MLVLDHLIFEYQERLLLLLKGSAYFLGGLLLAWAAGKLWDRIIGRLTERTQTELDGKVAAVSHRPFVMLVFLIILKIGVQDLSTSPLFQGSPFFTWFDRVFYAVLIITIAFWVDAVTRTAIDWYSSDFSARTGSSVNQFLPLGRQVARLLIFFLAVTIVLGYFGINISGLIATAGVASLAIALAAQETLSNMFAGLMIMLDRPFRPGDRIELVGSGLIGDVLQIGTRTTKILTFENNVIVVPNKDLANSRVINHISPDPQVTLRLSVGVAYGTDMHRTKDVLMEVLKGHPDVLDNPAPAVYFTEFGDSSLNLLITCWIPSSLDRFRVTDELNTAIKDRFEKEGIEIPFPQRTVHLKK
jgi:small-conductance mechanosensitive channel